MRIQFWKAVVGAGVTVQLPDFEPAGGYEPFLKKFCGFLGEQFLDWYQGIEMGLGHITYQGEQLTVVWNDFPFELSFDCKDEATAHELRQKIEAYFESHPS